MCVNDREGARAVCEWRGAHTPGKEQRITFLHSTPALVILLVVQIRVLAALPPQGIPPVIVTAAAAAARGGMYIQSPRPPVGAFGMCIRLSIEVTLSVYALVRAGFVNLPRVGRKLCMVQPAHHAASSI